jgi:hypothetical protein
MYNVVVRFFTRGASRLTRIDTGAEVVEIVIPASADQDEISVIVERSGVSVMVGKNGDRVICPHADIMKLANKRTR